MPSEDVNLPPLGGKFFYTDYFQGDVFGSHFVTIQFPSESLNLTISVTDEHMTVISSHCIYSCDVPFKYHKGPNGINVAPGTSHQILKMGKGEADVI